MTRDDIIRMAREAGCLGPGKGGDPNGLWEPNGSENVTDLMFSFASLVAAHDREKVARWMIERGYATGHGDTIEDLLVELSWQILDSWAEAALNGAATEREACALIAETPFSGEQDDYTMQAKDRVAAVIRARGKK